MKDLFENILYLIPIAFVIVVRIINARNKSNQQQQQQQQQGQESTREMGEILRRYREEEPRPMFERQAMEEMLPRTRTPDERKQKAAKKAVSKPAPKKPLSETASGALSGALHAAVAEPAVAAAAGVGGTAVTRLPVFANMPRIQQAVVWAEILGHPKSSSEGV
jgi:ATP-dependent protease Clp ATPase subunit